MTPLSEGEPSTGFTHGAKGKREREVSLLPFCECVQEEIMLQAAEGRSLADGAEH